MANAGIAHETRAVDSLGDQELEVLLQAKLGQGVEVRRGEVVVGRKSKVDVSVHGRIGTSPIFVAVDCAHLKDKVDVMKVGLTHAQFDDIGADHGIVVTTKGYAPGAVELAASHGIETCIMRPATAADLVGRTQDANVHVSVGRVSIERYDIELVDGTTRTLAPDGTTMVETPTDNDSTFTHTSSPDLRGIRITSPKTSCRSTSARRLRSWSRKEV